MNLPQLHYAGGPEGSGFTSVTPGVGGELLREAEPLLRYEPPLRAPSAGFPEALSLSVLSDGSRLLSRAVHTGAGFDFDSGYGGGPGAGAGDGFHAHAVHLPGAAGAAGPARPLPVTAWGSAQWEERTPAGGPPPPLERIPAPGRHDRAALAAFVADRGPWLAGFFADVRRAVEEPDAPRLLLVEEDSAAVARWVMLACGVLPHQRGQWLTFTTYARRPLLAPQRLVGVLPGDVPAEPWPWRVYGAAGAGVPGECADLWARTASAVWLAARPELFAQVRRLPAEPYAAGPLASLALAAGIPLEPAARETAAEWDGTAGAGSGGAGPAGAISVPMPGAGTPAAEPPGPGASPAPGPAAGAAGTARAGTEAAGAATAGPGAAGAAGAGGIRPAGTGSAPEAAAGNRAAPDAALGNQGTPDATLGNQGTPDATLGDRAAREAAAGDRAAPDATLGNQGTPDATPGDRAAREATLGNQGTPDAALGGQGVGGSASAPEAAPAAGREALPDVARRLAHALITDPDRAYGPRERDSLAELPVLRALVLDRLDALAAGDPAAGARLFGRTGLRLGAAEALPHLRMCARAAQARPEADADRVLVLEALLRESGVSLYAEPLVLRTGMRLVWAGNPPEAAEAGLVLATTGAAVHRDAGTWELLARAAAAAPAGDGAAADLAPELLRHFGAELPDGQRPALLLWELVRDLRAGGPAGDGLRRALELGALSPEPGAREAAYAAVAERLLAPDGPDGAGLRALAGCEDPELLAAYRQAARSAPVAERLRSDPGHLASCYAAWSAQPQAGPLWRETRTELLEGVLRPLVRELPAAHLAAAGRELARHDGHRAREFNAWRRTSAADRLRGALRGLIPRSGR
ncbi:GTPase-associated protein 1-related protein [Streptomyces sp. NPDC058734]|uniref:GTPase-associated protein 1-related protein n=1 Tax=Streptomyces sp. NPDC058734 TaxID=3346615 RepID=UPI0036A0535B